MAAGKLLRTVLLLVGLLACSAPAAPPRAQTASAAPPAAAPQPTGAPEAVPIRFGLNTPGAAVTPLWVAKEQGFFAAHGLDAELVVVPGADKLAAALLSGDVPLATIGAPALINAALGGADLVLFGSFTNEVRFRLFGRPELAAVADLRGKQVAVTGRGGVIQRSTEIVLERNGLDPERDVTFLAMGTVNEALGALLAGVVDATMQGPPGMFRAEDEGMRLLADTADYHYRTIQQGLTARRAWLAANEPLARGALQAVAEGVAFVQRNPTRTKEIIAQYTQADDPRLVERTYAALAPAWERDLRAPPDVLRTDLAAVAQDVPAARTARPEDFVDNHLADELERDGFFERLYQ